MKTIKRLCFCLMALAFVGNAIARQSKDIRSIETGAEGLTHLNQGWTDDKRDQFYNTPQGNLIIPYKWFLHLTQSDSEKLFRDNENIEKFGYLKGDRSKRNEDTLPVGFTKEVYRNTKAGQRLGVRGEKVWVGMTCAACHTAQINYGDWKIRVDGAPTMGNLFKFMESMNEALIATRNDPVKLKTLASKVEYSDGHDSFGNRLQQVIGARTGWITRNTPAKVKGGYGRLDAFGLILNEAEFAATGDKPQFNSLSAPSGRSSDAPVSYPFLWGTRWHDWVQWNAFAPRIPMARNYIQCIGSFGTFTTKPSGIFRSYKSSARLKNLRRLAKIIKPLRSPVWPVTIFKETEEEKEQNEEKLVLGRQLFKAHCISCHEIQDRGERLRRINVNTVEVSLLGTDDAMVRNFAERMVEVGKLADRRSFPLVGPRLKTDPNGLAKGRDLLNHMTLRGVSKNVFELVRLAVDSVKAKLTGKLTRKETDGKIELLYKGRPLEGIWATAPYLHNGSVPTLRQLLLPVVARDGLDARIKQFYVGSREFDMKEVGFKYKPEDFTKAERDQLFFFNTGIDGNRNTGHEYPDPNEKILSPEEIDALVLYQKSL